MTKIRPQGLFAAYWVYTISVAPFTQPMAADKTAAPATSSVAFVNADFRAWAKKNVFADDFGHDEETLIIYLAPALSIDKPSAQGLADQAAQAIAARHEAKKFTRIEIRAHGQHLAFAPIVKRR